jgi:hypothetical protein
VIGQLGPAFPRVLHPVATVERSALGRSASFRIRRVRAPEPLVAFPLDAVVLALGEPKSHVASPTGFEPVFWP